MIEIEQGSGNVYEDLDYPDADEMLSKARLASEIGEIIARRRLTHQQAAEVLDLSEPRLSDMLRGQFRGISEAKIREYLNRLS